ncbi:hypothetical protein Nepgr_019069 [Nepenthes gracilis]|uniref:Pectinesterase n=1 Tax=Nepenthes gracilis TaxID=150966 RepID=A0AAD3STC8_NEPGR|nr:hypothetical protein Nepgr_019069 [Nepenthes gracilis]
MSPTCATTSFLLLLLAMASTISSKQDLTILESARAMVLQAQSWAQQSSLSDCAKLYEEAEPRLTRLINVAVSYSHDDALTWLSATLTNHRTCLDSLNLTKSGFLEAQNLTMLLIEALAFYAHKESDKAELKGREWWKPELQQNGGLLTSWNPATSKPDVKVAKDGSGDYRTITEAVAAVPKISHAGGRRVIVYVKAGIYSEKVEVGRHHRNIMFVGDGIDRTVVTGGRSSAEGHSTIRSATFGLSGDGCWVRDMTFENTAGPLKHQAVALMAASDLSIFYRCSFKGYQDTLYAHSLRQFYRDCHIYGTVDFIFGNAAVVFQNCDILVRKPMSHQANMITAQGRDNPHENTGISIHGSRIGPAPDFRPVKGSFRTFLGRPWKKYSRTVISKSNIDAMIDPRGWTEWSGDFALSTLFYAEYMNTGPGSSVDGRVKWPGFHVLRNPRDVGPFTVRNFIGGDSWIPRTGVPVWLEI